MSREGGLSRGLPGLGQHQNRLAEPAEKFGGKETIYGEWNPGERTKIRVQGGELETKK